MLKWGSDCPYDYTEYHLDNYPDGHEGLIGLALAEEYIAILTTNQVAGCQECQPRKLGKISLSLVQLSQGVGWNFNQQLKMH